MRLRATLRVLLLSICLGMAARAVASPIDSLKGLIAAADHDTARAKYTHLLGSTYFNSNLDSALFYWLKALKLGESLSENPDTTVSKFGKRQIMRSASNTAVAYQYRGLYPLALKQYQRTLRIAEEFADIRGTMIALNNIGLIKLEQEKPDEALGYFERSNKLAQELQDSMVGSTIVNNIGTALKRLNRNAEALVKFRESLRLSELLGNDDQIVDDLINIGSIQIEYHQYDSALTNFERSLALAEEIAYSLGKPSILEGLSSAYLGLGKLDLALRYAQAGLDSARTLDLSEEILDALEQLAEIQQKLGQFQVANQTLLEFIALKDSLFTTSKALEFGQMEQSFDYERAEYEETIRAEKDAETLRRQNFKQYLISFATVCVIALLLLLGVRYARNRRFRYFVVFGALLFFFEFALVLLDNFVDGFTGGLPIPKLLANVLLAALFAPLNIVLERSLMKGKRKAVAQGRAESTDGPTGQ